MKTGLILLTCLPPTKGHRFLVDFAIEHLKSVTTIDKDESYRLYVIINGRPNEPIPVDNRWFAFVNEYCGIPHVIFISDNNFIVQEPEDHPDFWTIWTQNITRKLSVNVASTIDYVYASEMYGQKLAQMFNAKFVPCNLNRDVLDIKATQVREDPLKHFSDLLCGFQPYVRKTITIFGPESIGKTTLAKALAKELPGHFVPEWAREYLEKVDGPLVTEENMKAIAEGQYALQMAASRLVDKPFIIQDTDLFSTVGYYEMWDKEKECPKACYTRAMASKADYYILPNENIPFTPDPLRYGGNKRESNNQYWIDILNRYDLPYYQITSFSPEAQLREAAKACRNFFYKEKNWRFER